MQMGTDEGTPEDNSIFGLGSTTTGEMEDVPSSLMGTCETGALVAFKGRSKVWSEFFVTQDGKKVTCRRCGDSLAYSNSHSTSSMLKHLKRKHHMDLYPPNEEENILHRPTKTPQGKHKKGNKSNKRETVPSPPTQDEHCIQHDPLEFNEPCIRMRWTDHSDTFLRNFSCMYDDEAYTDVTLVAEKQFFKAHRIILSSASEFFDETFKLTTSGQHPVIFLKDTKPLELRMLLDFIYRGEVSIPPNLIPNLVKIGGDMRVRGLCDFVWNESMVPNAFEGYSNEFRNPVPVSNLLQSESAPLNPQLNCLNNNQLMGNRTLETVFRQQPTHQPQSEFPMDNTVLGIIPQQTVASVASTVPRGFSGPATKRQRLHVPTSVENMNASSTVNRRQTNNGDMQDPNNLLIIDREGDTILATSHVSDNLSLSAATRYGQLTSSTITSVPNLQRQNFHQDLSSSQAHSSAMRDENEGLPEVVYSITDVEVSGEQSDDEVLLSDTGDGENAQHTIVVYGDRDNESAKLHVA